MLTRLLHACGLYLGPKEELMPAQADNPDGFWEHLGFVAVNDELLNALGGAWDLPPKIDQDLSDPRIEFTQQSRLPAVPDLGRYGAHFGHRQNQQQP